MPDPPTSPRARFPVLRWLGHRQGSSQASVTPWAGSSNHLSASLWLTFPDQSKSAMRLCLSLTWQDSEAAPGNGDWGIPVLTLGSLVDQRRQRCVESTENSPMPQSKGCIDRSHGCRCRLCGPLPFSSAQLPMECQANLHRFQIELPPPARLCDPEQTNTSSMSRNDSHLRAVRHLQTLSPGQGGSRRGLQTRAPLVCTSMLSLQSCPTLCNPADYSMPRSPVRGILQARIPE